MQQQPPKCEFVQIGGENFHSLAGLEHSSSADYFAFHDHPRKADVVAAVAEFLGYFEPTAEQQAQFKGTRDAQNAFVTSMDSP